MLVEKRYEKIIRNILFIFAISSILISIGIIYSLVSGVAPFVKDYNFFDFLTGTTWNPQAYIFGVVPLMLGTLQIIFYSSLIAIPVGLASAIYLSEYASDRARAFIKPILEILAGIPSIVYGFFAYNFINPLIATGPYSVLGAGITVGIMITPMVASLSEDSMRSVPSKIREAAYGVGSTKFETVTKILIPSALSGIMASFILAVSRALGETMIVALAAGKTPSMSLDPFDAALTMTGAIVTSIGTDGSRFSLEFTSLYAIGITLFAMTLILNLVSKKISEKFRIKYD